MNYTKVQFVDGSQRNNYEEESETLTKKTLKTNLRPKNTRKLILNKNFILFIVVYIMLKYHVKKTVIYVIIFLKMYGKN